MKSRAVMMRNKAGLLLTLGALALTGCGGGSPPRGLADAPGLEPGLVVERFLRAANTIAQARQGAGFRVTQMRRELNVMMHLFGTRDAPIIDLYPREDVEVRMIALANLLRHDGYSILGNRIAAGRSTPAIEVIVRLETGPDSVQIPFTVVKTTDGGWRIERVAAERMASGR